MLGARCSWFVSGSALLLALACSPAEDTGTAVCSTCLASAGAPATGATGSGAAPATGGADPSAGASASSGDGGSTTGGDGVGGAGAAAATGGAAPVSEGGTPTTGGAGGAVTAAPDGGAGAASAAAGGQSAGAGGAPAAGGAGPAAGAGGLAAGAGGLAAGGAQPSAGGAGGAASNECRVVSGDEAHALVAAGAALIDVRTPDEYAAGALEGAVNVPLDELAGRLDELDRSVPVVVYCRSGSRSSQAAAILCDAGFTVYDLGAMTNWG
jgi:rhodanese-related sulfurtransferase